MISPTTAYVESCSEQYENINGVMLTTIDVDGDNVVGNTTYIFDEQGWKIKLHGSLSGSITNGHIMAKSTTPVKYAGKVYSIISTIDATDTGSSITGTKSVQLKLNDQSITEVYTRPFLAI